MSINAKQRVLESLKFARKNIVDMAATIPDNQATKQGHPTENHLAWTLGHLATSMSFFHNALNGKGPTLPESYDKLFGMGSTPSSDASKYPPIAELKSKFTTTFDAFVKDAEAMSDAELLQPPAIDTGGFLKDRFNAIEACVWHEGWHGGQVSANRRSLGLKSMYS